jgi:protocatechuate 3,4-dioxygenase beta subunit
MRRFLSLFTMLMLCGVFAFAQNRVVTGTITDDKGAPVEGASIRVKGTRTGASADAQGAFRISVPPGATLTISGVGVTAKEVSVGTQSVLM